MSAWTTVQKFQLHGLLAHLPCFQLNYKQEDLQLYVQWWTCMQEWCDVIFSSKSRFCLQHHNGRIHVWWHGGYRTLSASIQYNHTGPLCGVTVWGAIGLNIRFSPFLFSLMALWTNPLYFWRFGLWLYPLFEPLGKVFFSTIMGDYIPPILTGPPLTHEKFSCCPTFTFSRFLTNTKSLVNDFRRTGL